MDDKNTINCKSELRWRFKENENKTDTYIENNNNKYLKEIFIAHNMENTLENMTPTRHFEGKWEEGKWKTENNLPKELM